VLFAVVALLAIAMPAAAQAPVCPNWLQATNLWFIPPGCSYPPGVLSGSYKLPAPFLRAAGTNEDPFGGLAITSSKFGADGIVPGGVPSALSGDGTSARKAIYIGGAWNADRAVRSHQGETPQEIPACATVNVPAGASRWFKADTWKNFRFQAWVDDELATAKAPSGSAVFGGPDGYYNGLSYAHFRAKNALDNAPALGNTTQNYIDGLTMAVYDPTNLYPNYFFAAPNAAIFTVNFSGTGGPSRTPPDLYSGRNPLVVHGNATWNKFEPNHLLWYEAQFDGWVFMRVRNQMIWDQVASVCTYREIKTNPGYNFEMFFWDVLGFPPIP
jgi:hypothetical protein